MLAELVIIFRPSLVDELARKVRKVSRRIVFCLVPLHIEEQSPAFVLGKCHCASVEKGRHACNLWGGRGFQIRIFNLIGSHERSVFKKANAGTNDKRPRKHIFELVLRFFEFE